VFGAAAIDLFDVCCRGGKGGLLGSPLQEVEEEEEEKKKGKRERKGRKREPTSRSCKQKRGEN
jgi:hypothetical protein